MTAAMQAAEPLLTPTATATATAMKVSESEGKLEILLPAQNCTSKSGSSSGSSGGCRGVNSTKSWQYSDHMENISGYLMKYTNLVTGWQYRYFVLNNEAGLLEYFVNEQSRNQKPRGTLQLAGAVISPSDEDSHTFTVNAASGEQYKLRAADAKERQHWVSRLQICTQHHTEAIGKNNPPLKSRSFSLASQGSGSPGVQRRPSQNAVSFFNVGHHKLPGGKKIPILQPDHLAEVREMMSQAEGQQRDLIRNIEDLPASGHLSSLDQDLLMLKATSMATMNCLNDCFHILQIQHVSQQKGSLSSGTTISWLEPKISLPNFKNGADENFTTEQNKASSVGEEQSISGFSQLTMEPEEINPDEEVEDTCDNKEDDLGAVEEQRSVILHLLSQLKLGMDLTRVVLPTFILEKRSLLEMYADFMSHPDLFLAIANGSSPEERMIRFVEYYLTSFHEGRKGAIAKKPYNPIIGETFHCSWKMAKSQVPSDTNSNSSSHSLSEQMTVLEEPQGQAESGCYTVKFVAEQVSHHPPVSGFYAECAERKMCVNAHVWTKSKFLGMSIGVTMVGEGILSLLEHGEEYTFSLPCAYARSILTVPWVELGGKVNVNCAKTGYSASITFHTKPFYGGKLHRVTGEVKQNSTNTVVCRVQGEWNSVLEFIYSNGEMKCMDLTKLTVTRKRVRPLEKQGPFESRKLWQHVTESLKEGDIDKATEHKKALEEQQRNEERHRAETGIPWHTKHFQKEGDGWVYYNPLWKRMPAVPNQPVDTN
ncbi:oxysterol-binding protein-related protein 11 [Heteronotia binoei]|uniref:oxysterol-binding protein-related protein 11 n=1 Tax=Heteronotia binoei TaxID=13085 RepID=UPI002930A41C|nr:oxysterol-binding protein-related protein 11 [Heteronotia binoei]